MKRYLVKFAIYDRNTGFKNANEEIVEAYSSFEAKNLISMKYKRTISFDYVRLVP